MGATYVSTGEFFVTDAMFTAPSATYYIGWGTGSATDAKGDVDLSAPATETRVTATSEGEVSTASDVSQWISTLTAGTSKTVQEAGLYFHPTSTATAMIIRGTHSAVALATDDQIRYTFTLEQA